MRCRLYVRGEIDLANARRMQDDLDRAVAMSRADLIVDCTFLTFIDSSGIRALLATSERLQAERRTLRLENVMPAPMRAIDVLGLREVFGIDTELAPSQ